MHSFIFILGCVWTIVVWTMWSSAGHKGPIVSLECAVLLAPAYLLVSIRRRRGYAMRAFVVVSVVVLSLPSTRIVPGCTDLTLGHLCLPPVAAACVLAGRDFARRRKLAAHEAPRCSVCGRVAQVARPGARIRWFACYGPITPPPSASRKMGHPTGDDRRWFMATGLARIGPGCHGFRVCRGWFGRRRCATHTL